MTFSRLSSRLRIQAFMMAAGLVAATPMMPAFAAGIPEKVNIYTVSSIPVRVPASLKARTRIIHLDRIIAIEDRLAEGLDRIPDGSRESAATKRLSPALQLELKEAWEALLRIRQENITHLPAIVIDDRAVWYGSDLRRAVTQYRARAGGGS